MYLSEREREKQRMRERERENEHIAICPADMLVIKLSTTDLDIERRLGD